jgi:hypothetical protein
MLLKVKPVDIDQDYNRSFQVIDGADYESGLEEDFDPSVKKKILSHFKDDEGKLISAIDSIRGDATTPGTIFNLLVKAAGAADDAVKAAELIAPTISLISDMGTTLHFGDIIVKEVGYAAPNTSLPPGVSPEMTGRGFASEPPGRKLLDASDKFYLGEIKTVLSRAAGAPCGRFFASIMDVLTKCDPNRIQSLADADRTALGDFLAVYFAEADRNAMSDLKQHAWQKDLLHATCLSSYVASAGGDPCKFWAIGPSKRSGIGETRSARHELAMKVCNAEQKINSAAFQDLESAIGGHDTRYGGDLLSQLADYLNHPENSATILAEADRITDKATGFMVAIHDDAAKLADSGVPKGI